MSGRESRSGRPRICGVVPAAGLGTRLGSGTPKVFVPILPGLTIWQAVQRTLALVTDHIVLVLSPDGLAHARAHPELLPKETARDVSLGTQTRPLGMGDAVFCCSELWVEYDSIFVVWGDQFNLSRQTLEACVDIQGRLPPPSFVLPLVRMAKPYVEYLFDGAGRLATVRQSREGDTCADGGLADVGAFLLSGGPALLAEWNRYRAHGGLSAQTREVNFLPFLVHLSTSAGWAVGTYETRNTAEAVGINTPEDLEFARQSLAKPT